MKALLALLASVSSSLRDLSDGMRAREGVLRVERRCDLERSNDRVSAEWYVDAELTSGEALSFRVLLYSQGDEWIIESDVRRAHRSGQDLEIGLPTRFADDSDIEHEIRSVVAWLIDEASRVKVS